MEVRGNWCLVIGFSVKVDKKALLITWQLVLKQINAVQQK